MEPGRTCPSLTDPQERLPSPERVSSRHHQGRRPSLASSLVGPWLVAQRAARACRNDVGKLIASAGRRASGTVRRRATPRRTRAVPRS